LTLPPSKVKWNQKKLIAPKNVDTPERVPVFSGETNMKLNLLFIVIDILILLAYPIVYIIHRIRKAMGVK
jgi:hypothetical protein